jgi:hypothetical protein
MAPASNREWEKHQETEVGLEGGKRKARGGR